MNSADFEFWFLKFWVKSGQIWDLSEFEYVGKKLNQNRVDQWSVLKSEWRQYLNQNKEPSNLWIISWPKAPVCSPAKEFTSWNGSVQSCIICREKGSKGFFGLKGKSRAIVSAWVKSAWLDDYFLNNPSYFLNNPSVKICFRNSDIFAKTASNSGKKDLCSNQVYSY